MSKLLKKELRLAASPLSYWFLAFALMTMIPGYPILVSAFFVCLGLFQSYQAAREQNDVIYTALLPVRKTDIVRAKVGFTVLIECAAWLLCAVLTLVRMTALSAAAPYTQNAMMNANLVYLGWLAVVYGLFNLIFVRGYFKTAYKLGRPFVVFTIVGFLVVGAAEVAHHLPGLEWLNTTGFDHLGGQIVFLCAGIAFGLVMTGWTLHASMRSMERLDL
ncbi:MAG: ABC-2 transporter permease [Oscillospiraceae bacterium]|nr:ABC-2 transporter permease [Oscillospiraceae bacterium]